MSLVLIEKKEGIAVLTLNDPKKLNAFGVEMLYEFQERLDEIENDADVRCVIITGAGDKAFVAGGDIVLQNTFNVVAAYEWACFGHRFLHKLETLKYPVIGAINGYALGGGTEIALACDILIASENAIFAMPEVGLGIIPGFGGTQRLPRKVGINKAKEMIFTGARISADEAMRIGLVNKVVKHENLLDEALNMAKMIIKNSTYSVSAAKTAINDGMQCDLERGLVIEKALYSQCFATEEQKARMTAFVNKKG